MYDNLIRPHIAIYVIEKSFISRLQSTSSLQVLLIAARSYLVDDEKIFAIDNTLQYLGMNGLSDISFVAITVARVDVPVANINGVRNSLLTVFSLCLISLSPRVER